MNHSKMIVVNGFRRGGTSILWNILESHPQVCSPLRETGQIIYEEVFRWLHPKAAERVLRGLLTHYRSIGSSLDEYLARNIQQVLWRKKLENLTHQDNKEKFDGMDYTLEEVRDAVLCLKSVDWDCYLSDYFVHHFEGPFFVGLIRNGYAVCNGWMRRGESARKAGKAYRMIAERLIEDEQRYKNYILVRFEDMLTDPFSVAAKLFKFAELHPTRLEKLRLKSKRILSQNGDHQVRFGTEERKYWLTKDQITDFLDPDIDTTQTHFLSREDRSRFAQQAKPMLDYFGYS
jgi:hypothetical protein